MLYAVKQSGRGLHSTYISYLYERLGDEGAALTLLLEHFFLAPPFFLGRLGIPRLAPILQAIEDPMDMIRLWSVPPPFASMAGSPDPNTISVGDLLSGFIGAPPLAFRPQEKRIVAAAIDICLFAAAFIVMTPTFAVRDRFDIWEKLSAYHSPDERWYWSLYQLHSHFVEMASNWLAQQLPRRAFIIPLENAIRATSTLTYAGEIMPTAAR